MWAWIKTVFGTQPYRLNDDDIVVFVVGPPGGGKTWFMQEATKNPHIVARESLRPCTDRPVAVRCALTDEAKAALKTTKENNVVFVLVPSFDIDDWKDKAGSETKGWLKKSKSESTRVGAIYVDRVESNPREGRIQEHLDVFVSTFPQSFKYLPTELRVVLSYESKISEQKVQAHREAFQTQVVRLRKSASSGRMVGWNPSFHPEVFGKGGRTAEIAWNVVEQLLLAQVRGVGRLSMFISNLTLLCCGLHGLERSQRPDCDASPPPLPDLSPFIIKQSDRYIAGGGFGDVYKCRYVNGGLSKEVAVKALRFRFTLDGIAENGFRKTLRRELGIWRRLDHKNVVPFLGIAYGFGMQGSMSLVLLWMSNGSLQGLVTNYDNNLGTGHRLQLLLDIANGLHYLHSSAIVHGSLNSNNVLLDEDYTARLTDFGYASVVGKIPEAAAYLQMSTARPGALRFIAPEQVEPEEVSKRTTESDIFSFGCIALQVLSGKEPWSEVKEGITVVVRLARGQKPARPTSRMIDDAHWNLIQCCWSSMTERPSANIIVSHIQRFLNDVPPYPALSDVVFAERPQEEVTVV